MDATQVRCALYIRVSTRDQRYLQQFRDLRAAVQLRGWRIVAVYRERRSAAPGKDRPEWARLRADARMRRFGAVAAASLDRCGRSALDILGAVEDFRARGVRLYLQREGIATDDPTGNLLITVLAGVAQLERDLISERTRQGMRAARARGSKVGRPRAHVDLFDLESIQAGFASVADTARRTGVSVMTIRRRLAAMVPPKLAEDLQHAPFGVCGRCNVLLQGPPETRHSGHCGSCDAAIYGDPSNCPNCGQSFSEDATKRPPKKGPTKPLQKRRPRVSDLADQ